MSDSAKDIKAQLSKVTRELKDKFREMRHLETYAVYVGIPSAYTKREDGRITNAEIGYINEFGSPKQHIPPRPFLNPAIRECTPQCAQLLKPDPRFPLDPSKLDKCGLYASAQVKNYIRSQKGMVPLSPKTIAARKRRRVSRKAGTKALIDTANLLQSINYTTEREKE